VFQSFDTSALDTAPYPLNGAASKPDYLQQRFGATLGGPLVIGKLVNSPRTFFFLNYTGNHSRNPFDAYSTVPSLAERAATCRRWRSPSRSDHAPAVRQQPDSGGAHRSRGTIAARSVSTPNQPAIDRTFTP
jgi:hypothetical protein